MLFNKPLLRPVPYSNNIEWVVCNFVSYPRKQVKTVPPPFC